MSGTTSTNAQTILDERIGSLHIGRPRVWSVIITFFGDSIAPRGGQIRLSALQQILDGLNIQSQATRAAMSRLAQEGWLTRQKSGRESVYGLAEGGRNAFDQATRRIYRASDPDWSEAFEIVIVPSAAEARRRRPQITQSGFGELAPATFIRPIMSHQVVFDPLPGDLVFRCAADSSRNHARLASRAWPHADHDAHYHAFLQNWAPFETASAVELAPRNALLARTLLIHDWRRIVLRDADLPSTLREPDWPGRKARALVAELYHALIPASEAWLENCNGGPDGSALPKPDPDPLSRFLPQKNSIDLP